MKKPERVGLYLRGKCHPEAPGIQVRVHHDEIHLECIICDEHIHTLKLQEPFQGTCACCQAGPDDSN